MSLTFDQLETAFRARHFKPLYLLYGDESFLIDEAQRLLVEHALAPHERDFNLDVVYGAEAEGTEVIARCSAYPMMAERRVVLVRDFEKLRGNALFQSYAERPNPTAVVLLACREKPKNLNAHPYRALKQHAAWGEFKALKPREVTGWLTRRVKAMGKTLDGEAAALLADLIGTDLQTAASEADKLAAHVGTRTHIGRDDVIAAAGQSREFNVFELQKAVGDGRFTDALTISDRLLQQASNAQGEALRIVALLSTYVSKLHRLHPHLAARRRDDALAAEIGVPPFFVKEYIAAAARIGASGLDDALGALLAADYELKGGTNHDPRLVLLLLLRRISAPARPSASARPASHAPAGARASAAHPA